MTPLMDLAPDLRVRLERLWDALCGGRLPDGCEYRRWGHQTAYPYTARCGPWRRGEAVWVCWPPGHGLADSDCVVLVS